LRKGFGNEHGSILVWAPTGTASQTGRL
jgi:hypothetical protein